MRPAAGTTDVGIGAESFHIDVGTGLGPVRVYDNPYVYTMSRVCTKTSCRL